MRIIFIGNVKFSRKTLEHLINLRAEIVGVCTGEDESVNSDYSNLSDICENHNIPILKKNDLNTPEARFWIIKKNPDIIFCFGWSKLLKKELLSIPLQGVIGFHPSALPKHRGRHPLIWALVLGLNETASTFFFMDEGTDTGDIISQERILIHEKEDANSLYQKITFVALQQLTGIFKDLCLGNLKRTKQDNKLATIWRKRSKADGRIDWRMSANSIYNLVRGLSRPYVGAHFEFNGEEIKIWKSSVKKNVEEDTEPGKVLFIKNGCPVIKCGLFAIILLEIEGNFKVKSGDYL